MIGVEVEESWLTEDSPIEAMSSLATTTIYWRKSYERSEKPFIVSSSKK